MEEGWAVEAEGIINRGDAIGLQHILGSVLLEENQAVKLCKAAINGEQSECLRVLLYKGVDPNLRIDDMALLLHVSRWNLSVAMVFLLLQHGADVTLDDNNGWTALHYAAERGNSCVLPLLLRHGAHIDAQDADLNYTALHFACRNGHLECVRLLVEAGADITSKDYYAGETALDVAIRSNHQLIIAFLSFEVPHRINKCHAAIYALLIIRNCRSNECGTFGIVAKQNVHYIAQLLWASQREPIWFIDSSHGREFRKLNK